MISYNKCHLHIYKAANPIGSGSPGRGPGHDIKVRDLVNTSVEWQKVFLYGGTGRVSVVPLHVMIPMGAQCPVILPPLYSDEKFSPCTAKK